MDTTNFNQESQELRQESKKSATTQFIFWIVSSVLFMFVSNYGHSYRSIGFILGLLIPSSIPSIVVGGIACLIFKRFRNWRNFWFSSALINILLIVISIALKLYMNN